MGFGNLGFSEILVIFLIVLLFFGPKRLPEIARGLGGAMREFRRSMNQIQRELESADPRSQLREVNRILNDQPGAAPGTATSASPGAAPAAQPVPPQAAGSADVPSQPAPAADSSPADAPAEADAPPADEPDTDTGPEIKDPGTRSD